MVVFIMTKWEKRILNNFGVWQINVFKDIVLRKAWMAIMILGVEKNILKTCKRVLLNANEQFLLL